MIKDIAIGIVIALLFISIVILFCVLLVKLYIKKIKEYNQKDLDFQKTLTTTVIETQEQVLQNISQDLHDDAGQQLTYINFQIENLKLDSPEWAGALAPVSQSLGNLSKSIRGISHSLNNQLLLQQNLVKAIETEIRRLQKNNRIVIAYSCSEAAPKQFDTNEKIIIYRIFQECINNSFKHAKAKKIAITITTNPQFIMEIADNGKGFDVTNKKSKGSLGLLNMNSRANSINYKLTIKSQEGEGTIITLAENKIV
jgi:signal transduction histidine kinase